jgi:hypothetical protein
MVSSLDTTEGLYRETRKVTVHVRPPEAFSVVKQLGGDTGWLYGDVLWRLRGWIDQILGGVGFRKGRRSATDLRVGDAVDFWRVESLEDSDEHKMLRLRAEMQLPGRAWMQFDVSTANDDPEAATVTQTVFFEPKGLWGTLYWNLIALPHRILFAGMLDALRRRIETTAARSSSADSSPRRPARPVS